MEEQNKFSTKRRAAYIVATLGLFVAAPALSAILVQNFTQWDVVVDTPPITKVQGADADYDGDGDDTTGYLTVSLGTTISNEDDGTGFGTASSGTDTLLSHEEIQFTCFTGDRTYYTDVIQLDNTTASEDWDVTLTVEADIAGDPATEDTFTAGDADILLLASSIDSTTAGAVTELPNPANYGSYTQWNNDGIELEVAAGALSASDTTIAVGTIPSGEQRQLGLVVDCGSNMVDTETGTFRLTVAASPN